MGVTPRAPLGFFHQKMWEIHGLSENDLLNEGPRQESSGVQ
jgi:hypothetical protein